MATWQSTKKTPLDDSVESDGDPREIGKNGAPIDNTSSEDDSSSTDNPGIHSSDDADSKAKSDLDSDESVKSKDGGLSPEEEEDDDIESTQLEADAKSLPDLFADSDSECEASDESNDRE